MSTMRLEARFRRAELVAHTELLDIDPQTLDVVDLAGDGGVLFRRDGFALIGRGEALRIPVPAGTSIGEAADTVAGSLAAIRRDGEPMAPVAMGSLPFTPATAGALVVPEDVVIFRDGRVTRTTVAAAGPRAAAESAVVPRPVTRSPSDFHLRAVPSHDEWCRAVAEAMAAIDRCDVAKVVLARAVEVTADGPLVVGDILRRLIALFPSCTTFSIDGFVGASPELLVQRAGADVRCRPLAGTVARSGDAETDTRLAAGLLASVKNRREHAFVVDRVIETLAPLCDQLHSATEPAIVQLRNVTHLATAIRGRLSAPAGERPSALALAALLHPTPAVAGTPTSAALDLIAELEREPRGRYAGPVGWVDADGDGQWVVGIRSAEIDGHRARLMSGVGVVAGSDVDAELTETQLKLQALLAAIVRP